MMVSTKGRYALRLILDLAQHGGDQTAVSLKECSERQELSLKYLEAIANILIHAGLLRSQRGKDGGYLLARPAEKISVADVMTAAEGSLTPVGCESLTGNGSCSRASECPTLPLWQKLDRLIGDYLSGVSIRDLLEGKV